MSARTVFSHSYIYDIYLQTEIYIIYLDID